MHNYGRLGIIIGSLNYYSIKVWMLNNLFDDITEWTHGHGYTFLL